MIAIWFTVALILGALVAAMRLTWRKWATARAHLDETDIHGPGCYPRVER